MMRLVQILAAFLTCGGIASAASIDEKVADAQQCGLSGDYECSFEILIDLAENENLPLADNAVGVAFLTGAMLESSLIRASDDWSAAATQVATERYLDVVGQKHPDLNIFYATGHTLRAMSCSELGETACRTESAGFLCSNKGRLIVPMDGHSSHQEFTNRTIHLMNEECGEI